MNYICGVDEAGRGPLAGDVFAASVVLPEYVKLPSYLINAGIDFSDSKKISAKKRNILYQYIINTFPHAICTASVKEIDDINILQASLLAMTRSIEQVCNITNIPNIILIDGNKTPNITKGHLAANIECKAIVGGDASVQAISAASILAKVARDEYMQKMHDLYPQYAFNQHMGYPTKLHIERLKQNGITPIHRLSFKPIKDILLNITMAAGQSI
jgi:ribonuclease HII